MSDFWWGVIVGCVGLGIIAHIHADGEKAQCEQDNPKKVCELLWVPTSLK